MDYSTLFGPVSKKLHDVIREVLQQSPRPLTVREIADRIRKENLWIRPKDEQSPDVTQISARVDNYDHLFLRKDGMVFLKEDPLEKDNRLCKIVWNSNGWERPMERAWKTANQKRKNVGYEQQYGFVHEDWLFSPDLIFGDYQYGYIKGVSKLKQDRKLIDTVYLYTIVSRSMERLFVGRIFQIECLRPSDITPEVMSGIISYTADMKEELKILGADYTALNKHPFLPNMRFKLANKDLLPVPASLEVYSFHHTRTMPIKMTPRLFDLFHGLMEEMGSGFRPSSPDDRISQFGRRMESGTILIDKTHDKIEESLYRYLQSQGVAVSKIACDTMSFGGKLADVVVELSPNNFDIYEIKTTTDIRRGLREAIGQLLDYALWNKTCRINGIFAVLPYAPMALPMQVFVDRLKDNIGLPFQILLYQKENDSFSFY